MLRHEIMTRDAVTSAMTPVVVYVIYTATLQLHLLQQ